MIKFDLILLSISFVLAGLTSIDRFIFMMKPASELVGQLSKSTIYSKLIHILGYISMSIIIYWILNNYILF